MNEMTALASIERRIAYHIQGIYANALEVGRCLIEAKELVAHGDWEAWLRDKAGMNARTAQRLMQAAREVPAGSAMERLPISKIQAILALPEPEREAVAEKALEEGQTLRELQATVDQVRKQLLQAQRDEYQAVERAKDFKAQADKEREVSRRLRLDLAEAQARPDKGISREAQEEIDQLRKLADAQAERAVEAERMAEYQAAQRQAAQRELTEMKSAAARGDAGMAEDLTCESVGVAVRVFMGSMGYLPHTGKLLTMSYRDRQDVLAYAKQIGQWAAEVIDALEHVDEMIVIEEARHGQ